VIKLKTAADRFSRAVRSIDSWCRDNRHLSIPEQQQKLNDKLRGHYAYYGVTGNSGALSRFLWEVQRRWRKWLYRRSRTRTMNWGPFPPPAPALPAGWGAHRALGLPTRSESVI
jgi:RNA-directed DNA polymerase